MADLADQSSGLTALTMSSSSRNNGSSTTTASTANGITNSAPVSTMPAVNPDPQVSTPEQASSTWREFRDISQKLFRHSDVYSDIEKTMEHQHAVELQLQKQRERIRHLESNEQYQIGLYETRYDEWKKEKTALELAKKRVEEEMAKKHKRELLQVEKDLVHETERANTLVKKLERANSDANMAKKDLEFYKEKLQGWEQYTTQLKDVDFASLRTKLTKLFRDYYKLAETHICNDLPLELLEDYSQWEEQVNNLKLPLRFPPTNSPAAKRVRMAAALNIIAAHLCANIFKPCFVPESVTDSKTIKEVLASMADLRREEQFTRAVLVSLYPPEQITEAISRAVHVTLRDILKDLRIFLGDRVETFSAGLELLLERAAALSKEMQQSKKMVEVSCEDGDSAERADEYLTEFGELKSDTGPAKFEMLYLFPRFHVPEDNEVVYEGASLWPEQAVVVAAERELRDFKAGRRVRPGRGMSGSAVREPKRERRQSNVFGADNGSTSSSPTSPRTGRFPT